MRFPIAVVSLVLATLLVSCEALRSKLCDLKSFRLPLQVAPTHYDLLIRHQGNSSFEGQVAIELEVHEDKSCLEERRDLVRSLFARYGNFGCQAKNRIILNADKSINITEASFKTTITADHQDEHHDGKHNEGQRGVASAISVCQDTHNQLVAITFKEKLFTAGVSGKLVLKYRGSIKAVDQGFYASPYRDRLNATQSYVATQFESTYARAAFPCFDEPSFKSTFDIAIEHDRNLTALSNMEPTGVIELPGSRGLQDGDERVRTTFARTPPMSTYLVAFIVGQFDILETQSTDGSLTIRVATPPGQSRLAEWSLEVARRSIDLLLDYFQIEQPIRKIDMVPLKNFAAGAMENWGLVTFGEQYLLHSNETTSPGVKAYSISTIAHELTHFWFGNLVTPKWWDNLWLKEGFAQWMCYRISQQMYPEYDFPLEYVFEVKIGALDFDSTSGTHPIRNPNLKTVQEIEATFDAIAYGKGSEFIQMLSKFVGEHNFQLALRDYLTRNAFKSTSESDLWVSLEQNSGLPVAQLASSWLDQPGYPLIEASFVHDKVAKILQLNQHRFMGLTGSASQQQQQQQQQRWIIPISILISDSDNNRTEIVETIMKDTSEVTHVRMPKWFNLTAGHWLKLNPSYEMFYRVKYSDQLLASMARPIRDRLMAPIDRLNILDELRSLYEVDLLDLYRFEARLGWFKQDNHPGVIQVIVRILDRLRETYAQGDIWEFAYHLENYFENHIKPDGNHLTGSPIEIQAKQEALMVLVRYEYEPAIEMLLGIFDEATTNATHSQADRKIGMGLRESVYTAVARRGNESQCEAIRQLINEMEPGDERRNLLRTMFRDEGLERMLQVLGANWSYTKS